MAIGGGDFSGNRFAQTGMGFPQTGGQVGGPPRDGGSPVRESREERDRRLTAEERAEQEKLGDPTGLRPGPQQPNTQSVTKRVIVRRKRVQNGQTEGSNNANGSNGAEGARRGGATRGAVGYQAGNSLLQRSMMGTSSLIQASISHQNQQAQNNPNANNQSNVAVRNKMLMGLNGYIKNDYQAMRLNPDDKAFTYRTAEARQLHQTIGAMIASTSRPAQGERKESTSTTTNFGSKALSPEAASRGMATLRRLRAMTEDGKMPDNLPTDYRPFEDVA